MYQDEFERLTQVYVVQLRNEYHQEVNGATDKVYAASLNKLVLLEKCKYLPFHTVFFNELVTVFDHFYKLNSKTCADKTIESLSQIKKRIKVITDQIDLIQMKINVSLEGYIGDYMEFLPPCYQSEIQSGSQDFDELCSEESRIGALPNEKINDMLAIYQASQILLLELFPQQELLKEKDYASKGKNNDLVRLRQQLIYETLLKALGIDKNNCNSTDMTFVFVEFMGIELTKIIGSDTYKKMLDKDKYYTPPTIIENLEKVKSWLEKFNKPSLIHLVEQEIAKYKAKIK
ncbi:MAG: hypothetical protein K0R65_849 [Crocinitomicaceae bacterium]|nr:hypothetical protein [Crocinitomicaceae bacterium]